MLLLWMLGCMYLFDLELLSLLDIHPAVGLLDHLIALSEQFEEPHGIFRGGCTSPGQGAASQA